MRDSDSEPVALSAAEWRVEMHNQHAREEPVLGGNVAPASDQQLGSNHVIMTPKGLRQASQRGAETGDHADACEPPNGQTPTGSMQITQEPSFARSNNTIPAQTGFLKPVPGLPTAELGSHVPGFHSRTPGDDDHDPGFVTSENEAGAQYLRAPGESSEAGAQNVGVGMAVRRTLMQHGDGWGGGVHVLSAWAGGFHTIIGGPKPDTWHP